MNKEQVNENLLEDEDLAIEPEESGNGEEIAAETEINAAETEDSESEDSEFEDFDAEDFENEDTEEGEAATEEPVAISDEEKKESLLDNLIERVKTLFASLLKSSAENEGEQTKKKKEKISAVRLKPHQNPLHAIKKMTRGKKNTVLTAIEIDALHSTFHFYTMLGGDHSTLKYHTRGYSGALFDEEFFKRFKLALHEFAAANPVEGIRDVTLILPDSVVMNDIIKVPTMRGIGKTGRTLPHAMSALYSNYSDLRVTSRLVKQNRQHSSFAVTAVQKYILTSLYAACSENSMLVDHLTFHSAAAVSGAAALVPKQKNASYLLLNIRDTVSSYAFVANGMVLGTYTLPFGYEFLRKNKVTQEDMLFDHTTAELAVINARGKTKSKKTALVSLDGADDAETPENEEVPATGAEDAFFPQTVTDMNGAENMALAPKFLLRKTPRRLPKFMQRPIPETPEGVLNENFRVFVKWALTLIASNEKLTDVSEPEFVCVNLPKDLSPAVERVNAELEENGIPFVFLPHPENDASILGHLSLFGGFFLKQFNAGKL